jgi:Tfp pilus assembly protein PilO
MMNKLSPRESSLVAILILVAAIALVFLAVINPIAGSFRDRAAKRDQLALTLQANELRIANLGALQHAAQDQATAIRGMFIVAPNPDEAAESLREQLEGAGLSVNATIKATEAGVSAEEGWTRASLEARMTNAQLAQLLASLNHLKPAVVVETANIIAEDALTNRKSDQIDVRIEASAPFVRAN